MDKILITGGRGLVGSAIKYIVGDDPIYHFTNSEEADLSQYQSCYDLFRKHQPTKVIHLAANVGGLFKNIVEKVDMLEKNIQINLNVVKCSHLFGVKRFIGCLSTCIFPDKTTYPIDESMLHAGAPHWSNDAYAYAKRLLEIQCKTYREQYGSNFMCIIPTNIYGPHDNFNLTDSHVIPGLIHKCYLAKQNGEDFIVSGTGCPLRQFIYSQDLAKLIVWILKNENINESLILSPNPQDEISIGEIAELIANEFDYLDRLMYNTIKSDGQYRKTADNSRLRKLYGDLDLINIREGIKQTVKWFRDNYDFCRK
jgi:GDP-L-fucose synthase